MGESMRADSRGAAATTLNPAGIGLSSELSFEGWYNRHPEDSVSVISVAACDGSSAVPGCYYYRYVRAKPRTDGSGATGNDNQRTHEFGMTLARRISPNLIFGTTTKYYDYNTDVAGQVDSSGFAFDAGLIARFAIINLGVVGYNLIGSDEQQFPRGIGTGATLRFGNFLRLAGDAVWNLDHEAKGGRFGGGLEYFFSPSAAAGYPIRVGAVYDTALNTTAFTAGLGIRTHKVGLDVGASRQLRGGDETSIVASLRLFGPSL